MPTVEQIRGLLEKEPDDAFLHFSLAMALISAADPEGAAAAFDRALEIDGRYVPAWFQKGKLLAARGDEDEAVAVLRRGVEIAREVGDLHAAGEMEEFIEGLEV